MGHTRDEFSLLAASLDDVDDVDADTLVNALTPTPGARRYRAAYTAASPAELRDIAMSDWLWRMPALHLAEAAHTGGARVWLYELCWGFNAMGASHGLDTLLVFGTTEIRTGLAEAGRQAVAQARRLSGLIRSSPGTGASAGNPGVRRGRADRGEQRAVEDQVRLGVAHLGAGGEVVDDQPVQVGAVGHRDVDEEVLRSGHGVEGQHLGQRHDRGGERLDQLPAVRAQLDRDERVQPAPQGRGVDHRAHGRDHAERAQPPHPLVARRRR